MKDRRKPLRPDRVRTIPGSFSWIDRELLHRGILKRLTAEEKLLYFFLALVAGPEGTSFWSYRRIGEFLDLTEEQVQEALRGLVRKDLAAFHYPTFQLLSLPEREKGGER